MADSLDNLRKKWQPWCEDPYPSPSTMRAKDYIAALEAECEALRVCGNCHHMVVIGTVQCYANGRCAPDQTHPAFPCHFTPSRWERRTP